MNKKQLAGLIVIAVAAFFLGWSFGPRPAAPVTQQPTASEQQARTVSVMFDFGEGTVKSYNDVAFSDGEHLFDVTKRLAEQNNWTFQYDPPGQYGIFIQQIGDMRGGPPENKYWTWYENNRMGQIASDAYVLKSGDVLEWKFVNLKME